MTFPQYVKPLLTGKTWASGAGTQQAMYDGMLSYQSDAQAYATAIGANLRNAMDAPDLKLTIVGVTPEDTAQPWVVQWQIGGPWAFAGIAINQEVAANGGTIGNPGNWIMEPTGVWIFVPTPAVVAGTPTSDPNANLAADMATYAAIMGAGGMSNAQFQALVLQALGRIVAALRA